MLETPARNASAKSGFLSLFHIKFKKFKKVLDYLPQYGYNKLRSRQSDKQSGQGAADKLNNGLSPNGKATDSDSVISRFESL